MDTSVIAPFLIAREAYLHWAQERDACLRMVEQRLSRSKARAALTRFLATQTMADARLQADGAAIALADRHGESVFASAGLRAPTDVFFGRSLRTPDASAGPRQSPGGGLGLPELLMLVDLEGATRSFLASVRDLPGLPSPRKLAACERRFKVEYDRATASLKGQCDGEASCACAAYFRQALPKDVGTRVIDYAY